MPTFNDERFISSAIESVLKQDYSDWELLISDDASPNGTESVVSTFLKDERIKYFRSNRNEDQLNALYKITSNVSGDLVTLLHSDDMFSDEGVLSRIVSYFKSDINLQGVYADLLLMDRNEHFKGFFKTPPVANERIIRRSFLALGANLLSDVFCVRSNVFFSQVLRNYILWNTFYWLKWGKGVVSTINLRKIEPWYKYRRGDNYLTEPNEIRRAFVLSGCFRTMTELSYYYCVNGAALLQLVSRIPKVRRLARIFLDFLVSKIPHNADKIFTAFQKNSYLLEIALESYTIKSPLLQKFFVAPIDCMRGMKRNKKIIDLKEADLANSSFFGKDSRIFFEMVTAHNVPHPYMLLVEEAKSLRAVRVREEENVNLARNLLRFLCLPLPILVGNEHPNAKNLQKGFQRRFSWE